MLLSKAEVTRMLRKAAQVWNGNKDYLSETGSRFGDGDHGVTIGRTTGLIEKSLDGWDNGDVEASLEDLGDNTMEIGGGSAGLLHGTMIGGLPGPLEGDRPTDAEALKEMFTECLSAMEGVTNAGVGGKTMIDTLVPTVEVAQSTEDNVMTVLGAAKEVAAEGAKENKRYMFKYGRARSYKEKTIGTPDAGAMSTSLFFVGLCDGLKQTTYGSR